MAATIVERLAEEVMTFEDFSGWLKRNDLTFEAAAAKLGISRRLVAYYASGSKQAPRYISLACKYLDRKQNDPPQEPEITMASYQMTGESVGRLDLGSGLSSKVVAYYAPTDPPVQPRSERHHRHRKQTKT